MKIEIDRDLLNKLYILENKTVKEIAEILKVGTATVNRKLKEYEIKKSEEQRQQAISKTKQNKTEEEKALYSQHISEARKGKGIGATPWNKGKKGSQVAWNKGLQMSDDFKDKVKQGLAQLTEEQKEQRSKNQSKVRKGRIISEEQRQKIRATIMNWTKEQKLAALAKEYQTKKQNNSFNTSKPEEIYFNYLKTKYSEDDIIRQYIEERYPFKCDFYIKSLDLFIELNLSWTHGGKPFEGTEADLIKLDSWKEKAKTSKFYENAIETWTVRDVQKFNIAKQNNLNYKVYYSEEEIYNN